jgi:hypothetical protein
MAVLDQLKDGGYKSRKLWLAVFGIVVLGGGWAASGHWTTLQTGFGTFTTAVVSLVGLYFGVNVGTKATLASAVVKVAGASASGATP